MKVVISAGHALKVRGAAGPSPWGLDEVDCARDVVTEVATVLRGMGVETITYWDDVSVTQSENLDRIVNFHNSAYGGKGHDLDVSIHFNAYDQSAHGVEVLYRTQKELAQKVGQAISSATGLTLRGESGAVYRDGLAFLNNTIAKSILVETLFCDNHNDADVFRAKFSEICTAIAEGISGKKAQPGPTPPERPSIPTTPTPPPSTASGHQMVEKGDSGSEVVKLQKALGCLVADGNFGTTTDTWVRAFQAACDLYADGVVGNDTWDEVDDLVDRVETGKPPLRNKVVDKIWTMAATSEIADYSWPDRGIAPTGYIAGLALSFAYALRRGDDDDAVNVMSQAQGNPEKDALAWYEKEFSAVGMSNKTAGPDTLRHLFVMMMGLGMRESSGRYCEGRDMSASNVESDTCEAGLYQTSWNIRSGSPAIEPLLGDFWDNPNGFLPQFKEGITATASNLNSYGNGDGARYQFLSRFAPLFHVMVTGTGMRTLRQHWGPINRREVTLRKEADALLKDVQELVSAVS